MKITEANLADMLDDLRGASELSLDTETTGLSETDFPFALVIAAEEWWKVWYLDLRELQWWNRPELQQIFSDQTKTWYMQNAKFDMRMIGMAGYAIEGKIIDINVAARLVRNDHFAYSLEAQAKRFGKEKGADVIKKHIADNNLYEMRKDFFGVETKQPRYDQVPLPLMYEYAVQDARLTFDLAKHYLAQLSSESLTVLENEAKLTKVCFDMERRGLLLNQEYTIQARYHEMEIVAQRKAEYKEATGQEFVDSAKSFQKWIGDRFQLPQTAAGNPSLTKEVLDDIIDEMPEDVRVVAKLIKEIRHHEKRINTYYDGYLCAADKDGVVHPTMWQAGTSTGRFSYSNPNLQNIPKEKKSNAPFVVRGCFKPRPGTVFVSFDYAQMEYRLLAAYANESDIIRRVMGGEDFHDVAASMFGVERDPAKTLNFAILYGAGDSKLSRMLGVAQSTAQRLKLKYFLALPRVEKLIDKIKSIGKSRGYVTTWLGRNLYSDPQGVYALPNHLIQGGGADVVKVAMVNIAREVPTVPMVLQVHDQLIFEVRPDQYGLLPKIQELMETAFPPMNGMQLKVDVEWSATSLAVRDMTRGMPC